MPTKPPSSHGKFAPKQLRTICGLPSRELIMVDDDSFTCGRCHMVLRYLFRKADARAALTAGLSPRVIARKLGVMPSTVKAYLRRNPR